MMEENLSDFLLFLIHSNKFHKNKIWRTIFNQKSSTWKSKKYIKEEWVPISYSLSEQTHKQMTKKSKPRNQETKKSAGFGSFHNPSTLDEILSHWPAFPLPRASKSLIALFRFQFSIAAHTFFFPYRWEVEEENRGNFS